MVASPRVPDTEVLFYENAGRLRSVLDSIYEGLQVLSTEWRYLYLNPAAARHAQRERDDLLGRSMLECFPGVESTATFAKLVACRDRGERDHFENEFTYPNGERAWFELWIEPCPEGLVIVSLDITARKQLEAILRRTEKLSALGRMAASVAHNLGNILNPLALQLELLARRARDNVGVVEIAERMKSVLAHGKETIDSLKGFGRDDASGITRPVEDLRGDRVEVGLYTARTERHGPAIRFTLEAGQAGTILVNAGELVAAIVNLVTNSIEAMQADGTIIVRTGRDAGHAWLEVVDDGPGMSEEIQARAFEPFFTTKGDTGTGLGLASVYALAKRHAGDVRVRSVVGEGTTIRLSFPLQR